MSKDIDKTDPDYLAYANTGLGTGVWGRGATVIEAVELAARTLVLDFVGYGNTFGISVTFEVADVTGFDEIQFGGGEGIRSGKHKFTDSTFITVTIPKIKKKGSHHGATYKYRLLKSVALSVTS